jgi:hypothetical protein
MQSELFVVPPHLREPPLYDIIVVEDVEDGRGRFQAMFSAVKVSNNGERLIVFHSFYSSWRK